MRPRAGMTPPGPPDARDCAAGYDSHGGAPEKARPREASKHPVHHLHPPRPPGTGTMAANPSSRRLDSARLRELRTFSSDREVLQAYRSAIEFRPGEQFVYRRFLKRGGSLLDVGCGTGPRSGSPAAALRRLSPPASIGGIIFMFAEKTGPGNAATWFGSFMPFPGIYRFSAGNLRNCPIDSTLGHVCHLHGRVFIGCHSNLRAKSSPGAVFARSFFRCRI